MIVYNVTAGVDKTIEAEWLHWMQTFHIPNVMRTGCFVTHKIYKVLTHDDPQSVSFAIQYIANTMDRLQEYFDKHAPALRQEVKDKFGEKQVSYRTVLEEVNP